MSDSTDLNLSEHQVDKLIAELERVKAERDSWKADAIKVNALVMRYEKALRKIEDLPYAENISAAILIAREAIEGERG